jgi:hypothetical protein
VTTTDLMQPDDTLQESEINSHIWRTLQCPSLAAEQVDNGRPVAIVLARRTIGGFPS